MNWPPPYQIKKSLRARHVRLKISPRLGLQLIVPKHFDCTEINELLNTKKAWINKHLSTVHPQETITTLPNEIYFPATGQHWKLQIIAASGRLKMLEQPHTGLIILGDSSQVNQHKKLLTAWIKQKAQAYLVPLLTQLSMSSGLSYSSVTIRNQKTRWGSCSATKSISLNYKLIFLPPEIIRHVLFHELCHIKHLNHSQRFWNLLAKLDPEWKTHKQALKSSQTPLWLD